MKVARAGLTAIKSLRPRPALASADQKREADDNAGSAL